MRHASTPRPALYYLLWLCVPPSLLLAVAMIVSKLLTDPVLFAGREPIAYAWAFISCPVSIAVGLFLARRVPGNIIAPALILWGVCNSVWIQPENLSMTVGPFLVMFIMAIGMPAGIILFTWFPNGQASPRGWEPVYTTYFILNAVITVVFVLSNPTFDTVAVTVSQPHHVYAPALAPFAAVTTVLVNYALIPSWLFIPVAMIARYRRASITERQQIKWMVWLVAIAVISFIPIVFYVPLFKTFDPFGILAPFGIVRYALYTYFQLVPAFAIVFAILRHKLYDIDIIIRRTLIYTVLTTILGVVYFGGIVLTQQVFRALIGQSSELAIVASTLLIAALFAPLRRRVQDVIDRRLYRKKYDAEKVLADFQKNLRDEVDMETLKANLIGVLEDTMQPTKIALWVKEEKS